jgi:hypothetical protein
MSIHDLVQTALLVVITIFSIGRWAQSREDQEAHGAEDAADVQKALDRFCLEHKGEHDNLWREVERQRRRWHDELAPWRQTLGEKIARFEEHERAQDSQLAQLWSTGFERRRTPRD